MDEYQWMYDSIMSEEVYMNDQKEDEGGVNEEHVDCSDAFNTSWEHNDNSYTTIKQIYNARNAYRSSIRDSNNEIQQLMKLLKRDQYIHWHRLKDEDVVRDIFWSHYDAVKLGNACNLVFLIDNTYKTNRYRLSLLDIVGVTPIEMTFSIAFAYLEGECLNHVVWGLQWFQGFFLKREALPGVIVTDRDLALMSAVKTVFPEANNFLCRFHIDKNVKAKVESTHWALKRLLQNSLRDLCSISEAINNMITLQHPEIKISFETSTHRLSFLDQGLFEPQVSITEEMETISKRFKEFDVCGKVTLKIKLWEISYPDLNSMCAPPEKSSNSLVKRSASSSKQPIQIRNMPMLDQFHPCIHDSIVNIVDVKTDGNCGYRAIAALLGMGEDSWSLVHNHLLKELTKWSDEYINLVGGIDRFEELKHFLLVNLICFK
ncbi:Protein FAR1-RELATED SEQUENCE 5 [Glycine max]|nr:Protein FAR1-RELATED SEQUENCE 5 [Glycine max]